MKIQLCVGPLGADGYKIHRSGVRWLVESGQICRANQVIAYYNLNIVRVGPALGGSPPFADERELQVALAPRVAGRILYDSQSVPGGYLSILGFNQWDAETVLGDLEVEDSLADLDDNSGRLRLLLLAGRRMTPLVDVHSGLLQGWHSRSRAWWGEDGATVSLLSLGVCDVTGVIMGEQYAFLEMFRAETAPSQFILLPDHPIAPAAPVLLDQLERSPAQFRAISADLHSSLSTAGSAMTSDDWMFAGTMLSALQRCPILETYDLLSASTLTRSGPADALLLSLNSEPSAILRHKTLGYRVNVLRHHQAAAGPAIRNWFASSFEFVQRTTDDIKADYERLIDGIKRTTGARVMILNRMSTSGDENISTYAPFDAPLSGVLANVASKELNLMLHDVAEDRNVAIIDVDAIAADIGGGEHLPDGVHQSGVIQDLLRGEILRAMNGLRPQR
jgi:hypothetical protein